MDTSLLTLPDKRFREVKAGFERLRAGSFMARHAHLKAYATVVLEGSYGHAGYFGRQILEPGDVLVTPVLDRHENFVQRKRLTQLLRFDWVGETGLGGVYRPARVDEVITIASQDPFEARQLLHEMLISSAGAGPALVDWPDLLAQQLRSGPLSLSGWAEKEGLARETVSRGFHRTFGVAPQAFSNELRARQAWIRILESSENFASIAADIGYSDQPHMTRAVRALTGLPPGAWRRFGNRKRQLAFIAAEGTGTNA